MASVGYDSAILLFLLKPLYQSSDASFIKVLVNSFRAEGPRFLFKGWTPAFIRLGPNTVLLFVFLEVSIVSDQLHQ